MTILSEVIILTIANGKMLLKFLIETILMTIFSQPILLTILSEKTLKAILNEIMLVTILKETILMTIRGLRIKRGYVYIYIYSRTSMA